MTQNYYGQIPRVITGWGVEMHIDGITVPIESFEIRPHLHSSLLEGYTLPDWGPFIQFTGNDLYWLVPLGLAKPKQAPTPPTDPVSLRNA